MSDGMLAAVAQVAVAGIATALVTTLVTLVTTAGTATATYVWRARRGPRAPTPGRPVPLTRRPAESGWELVLVVGHEPAPDRAAHLDRAGPAGTVRLRVSSPLDTRAAGRCRGCAP